MHTTECQLRILANNILAGLGWKEGQALGRNCKYPPPCLTYYTAESSSKVSKPIVYLSRQKGLGLGAKALNIDMIKGMKNMGKDMHGKRSQHENYTGGAESK
jgi:hypothetical protein